MSNMMPWISLLLNPDGSAFPFRVAAHRHLFQSAEPYCVRQARQAHVRQLPGLSRGDWTPLFLRLLDPEGKGTLLTLLSFN